MTPSVGTVTQLVRNKSKVFGNSTRNKTLAGRDEKNMNLMNKFQTLVCHILPSWGEEG